MIISKGHLVACDTPEGLTGLMNGNDQIELTILGSKEQVEEVLSGMEHLQAFSLKEGNEADGVKAVIESEAEVDIRTNLFYTLAKAKLPIMSMTRLEKSLEDVFLELTDSNKTAEEKGGVEDDSNL